jgi:predicted small metal-binding protein
MKTFNCGTLVPGCTATFLARTEGGILQQVTAHAEHLHGIDAISQELVEQVCAHIRTVVA